MTSAPTQAPTLSALRRCLSNARRQPVKSYSGLHRGVPLVVEPRTDAEIADLLVAASTARRHVTPVGGRMSFDRQALGDDIALDLARFDRVEPVRTEGATITVGAGARWGDVVREALARGFAPYVVPTTARATAGGTLSANCVSRSTPVYGKEGDHVVRFRLVAPCGDILECSRETNADVFHAAIGGFGFLGVVTEITYDLLPLGRRRHVETTLEAPGDLDHTIAALDASKDVDAAYATFAPGPGGATGIVFRSRYVEASGGRRFIAHDPARPTTLALHLLMRSRLVRRVVWRTAHRWLGRAGPFVDRLPAYHFIMDAHVRTKRWIERFGLRIPTVQHTYFVGRDQVVPFCAEMMSRVNAARVYPTLLDVLPVPADDFLLSSGRGRCGYVVSIAFDVTGRAELGRVSTLLSTLVSRCFALGGRLHLVKNVPPDAPTIRAMYADVAPAFLDLERRLDPQGVLRSGFFDLVFGDGAIRRSSAPL